MALQKRNQGEKQDALHVETSKRGKVVKIKLEVFCLLTLKAKALQSVKSFVVIHQLACRNNPDNLTLQQMSVRSSNVDLQEQNTRNRPTNYYTPHSKWFRYGFECHNDGFLFVTCNKAACRQPIFGRQVCK